MAHVRQKHDMNEKEYKKQHGLELGKGICSKRSSELSRQRALENYDVVIKKNLLENGKNTRFKDGSKGRTKDKVSEQTRIKLSERIINLFKKKK